MTDGADIGAELRRAREGQGRTLEEAARAVRVRTEYIRALEDGRFEIFGGDVYAKGFLRAYARFLGLDPEPLLERYRREVQREEYDPRRIVVRPVAAPPRAGLPGWLLWGMVAVVLLVLTVSVANLLGGGAPQPAATPSAPPAAASPPPRTTPPPATTTPAPSPTGVRLVVLVEEECWIEARVDGVVVEAGRIYAPGETLTLDGRREVAVVFGNAGGVRVTLNGRDLGAPGRRGEVVRTTYGPSGPISPAP